MERFGLGVLVAVIFLAGIGLVFYAAQQAKKRRDTLWALARKLGWQFSDGYDYTHTRRFRQFSIFIRGHGHRAYNTMHGEIQIAGRAFDGRMGDFMYKVTRQSGKSRSTQTYRFSYLLLRPPLPALPELRIRPEGILDKIAGAVGFDDIDFESEEFSRRFHVKSSDKRFAYDVLHPRMMEFLLRSSAFVIELDGGWCCLSDGRTRWQPEAFEQNLAWLGRFFEQWPDYLLEQLEGGRTA